MTGVQTCALPISEFYRKRYHDVYLTILDELSPFNSQLAVSRPPRIDVGVHAVS